ncbi:MAG: xanthine dehydrogenase family protein molybdopterin-binding subunit, partial [Planctomycetes bacterium]|nr:xanthine dehydrogenase family protein molybdopterin-binding subunit [Planctomycetota bacterium]
AHAQLTSLDTTEAQKMPGVKAVYIVVKPGKELYYAGDEIAGIAADTEERAQDALRAIKTDFKVLDFLVKEEDALKATNLRTVSGGTQKNNLVGPSEEATGNVEEAFAKADAVIEGTYGVPVICHQCLESHGIVAEWGQDGGLTVWCSTQAVYGTADQLAKYFRIPMTKVKCITYYMGGGFGSKFGPDIQGFIAAELARQAGAPVKLMLDREEEVIAAGNRPSASGKVKMAGSKDGKITAYQIDSQGSPGVANTRTVGPLPYIYSIPNTKVSHTVIRLNAGGQRAFRAPGHPQSCFLTDCPLDDLAAKLDLDPMQVRLRNLPENDADAVKSDPTSFNALRRTIYTDEIQIAAKLAEWDKKWHRPGQGPAKGSVKHGIGMGLNTWGGMGSRPNDVDVTISSDGSVLVRSSTQDLGPGERTVLPIIMAEVLGLNVADITVQIGESTFGRSQGSGGSTTCAGTSPPAYNAVVAARDALFAKIAPRLGVKPEDLSIAVGQVVSKAGGKSWSWKEACAKLGRDTIQERGQWSEGLANNGVGGVQIAEVLVDTETGEVRCTQVVAVQDCGTIINKLCCESQVAGGVIMGVNYALFEERILDRRTGRQVNPNMEFYKIAGIQDIPRILVHMHDMPERGVIGIGEPPTIATCAAVGNAIFNAIGVRVPFAPFTTDRVLAALSRKGGTAS